MAKIPTSKLAFLLIATLITTAIIFFLNNKDRLDPSQQIIDIKIEGKKLKEPANPIQVEANKKVTFLIKIDEEEQFHLEGYHAFTTLKPGKINKLQFQSLTPGNFPAYLDKSHTSLATIEIK